VISTSVPQTPTAIASTSTDPARASGSASSSSRTLPARPGSTVMAFMPDLSRDRSLPSLSDGRTCTRPRSAR
jgi:hypothetical protein